MKEKKDKLNKFFNNLRRKRASSDDPEKLCALDQTESVIRNIYLQTHRYYHNLDHINYCLKKLKEYRKNTDNLNESDNDNLLKFAIVTHDIVYIPENDSDKIHGAFVAKALIQHLGNKLFYPDRTIEDISSELETLIYITTHSVAPCSEYSKNKQYKEAIIADCDLSILGGNLHEYKFYEHNLRQEYEALQESYFYRGRLRFLQQLMAKKQIFWTEYFQDTYGRKARENILESIDLLTKKIPQVGGSF